MGAWPFASWRDIGLTDDPYIVGYSGVIHYGGDFTIELSLGGIGTYTFHDNDREYFFHLNVLTGELELWARAK